MAIIYLIIAFTLNALGNVALKVAANRGIALQGTLPYIIEHNYFILAGFILYAVNALFYVLALRALPLSIAYPVMVVMSLIIINLASLFFLNERINSMQVIGYVLLIAGMIIIFYFGQKMS